MHLAGVGKYLKQAREKKSYTLEDMADLTNIEIKYLQALESEEYDLLPSPFYARVFMKTYAKYLNLNVTSVMQLFDISQQTEHSPAPKPMTEAVELPKRSPAQKKKVSSLWLIVAIILIMGMVYMLFQ
jgi:cytoskeletal protein RodZ